MRTFGKFVAQNMIYRSKKPVLWSYGAQTALAEAEVEYKDKVSPSSLRQVCLAQSASGLGRRLHRHLDHHALDAACESRHRAASRVMNTCAATFTHESGQTAKLIIATALVEAFTADTGYKLSTEHANQRSCPRERN